MSSLRYSNLLKKQGGALGCLCEPCKSMVHWKHRNNCIYLWTPPGETSDFTSPSALSQVRNHFSHADSSAESRGKCRGSLGPVGSSTCCASKENCLKNVELHGEDCGQPHVENGAIMQLIMANPFCHEFLITLASLSQKVINIFLIKEYSSKAGILPRGPWVIVQGSNNSRSWQLQMISWAHCGWPECTSSGNIKGLGSQATPARGDFRPPVAFRCGSVQEALQDILTGSNRRVPL